MTTANLLIRTLAHNGQARILFVQNADLLNTVCDRPAIRSRLLRHALGLTVSAASLLSGTLKDRQRLSLKVKASRPGCAWFADVDASGNVRGYPGEALLDMPPEELDSLSLPQLIGDRGFIQLVKDVGMYRSVTGITDMPHRNIVDDLAHYFGQSEQTPTHFAIHIDFDGSGRIRTAVGVMAQLLPGAPDGLMDRIREAARRLPDLAPSDADGDAFRQVPFRLFRDIEWLDERRVQAYCGCSKAMLRPMLYALGPGELTAACERNRHVEIVCRICGQSHVFTPDEIKELLARDMPAPGSGPPAP
jgi:molecular chaperone Hsp33